MMPRIHYLPTEGPIALIPTQCLEIPYGAQMDVGGVVPGFRQGFGNGHAPFPGHLQPTTPVAEVGKGHDAFPPYPQHFLQQLLRVAYHLQGLGQDHIVEGLIGEWGESLIHVHLNDLDAGLQGTHHVVRINFQTIAGHLPGVLQVTQQRAIPTTQVQHPCSGADPVRNDFQIGTQHTHAPISTATRCI